jgi:tetratricopeptide (TPR) repeat protein
MLEDLGSFYYNKGLTLMNENRISDGMQSLKKSLIFGISSSSCFNLLGLCLFCLGRFDEADAYWKKSITIDDGDDNPAHSYVSYLKDKDFHDMRKSYNKALEYAQDRKYKKVIKILENGNLLKSNCVLFQNLYGLCLYASGDNINAHMAWMKSLKIDSSNADTLFYLSNAQDKETKGILGWIANILKFKEH